MFSSWKTPTSSKRQQELKWLNIINEAHDFFCHCDNPTFHLIYCINKFSGAQKPEIDLKNIQCLLTGDTITTEDTKPTEEDAGFLDGELERLFDEDGDTKENSNPDTR